MQNAGIPASHTGATTPSSITPHQVELSDMQGTSTSSHSSSVTINNHSINATTTPIATPRASRQVRLDMSSRSTAVQQPPATTVVTPSMSSTSLHHSIPSQQLVELSDDSDSTSSSDSLSSDEE